MGNLDAALNNALIARRPGIAAITPLANYVGFFSAGRNAPLLHLEAIFLLSDGQEFSFSHHAGTKPSPNFEATILIDFRDARDVKVVLEDIEGKVIMSSDEGLFEAALAFQIQTTLDDEVNNTLCGYMAVRHNGTHTEGLWITSPSSLLWQVAKLHAADLKQSAAHGMSRQKNRIEQPFRPAEKREEDFYGASF